MSWTIASLPWGHVAGRIAIIKDRLVTGLVRKTSPPQGHDMSSEWVDLGYDIALINWGRSIEDTKCNMNAGI